ncbi:hypothetical protein Plut_1927 [Pelodictyon luteolum DSM 273]|uniref:Uncharacterized protein n=1 Tax=Chlorobium luteolum (strain DSM 273 / BCRC 81028 / 2530) TaxID=319225 RepID=Q3B1L2_CHLL3|nr:hypothetical protein Plut_1927 [Pelodictyon luteolum DSM 273]
MYVFSPGETTSSLLWPESLSTKQIQISLEAFGVPMALRMRPKAVFRSDSGRSFPLVRERAVFFVVGMKIRRLTPNLHIFPS